MEDTYISDFQQGEGVSLVCFKDYWGIVKFEFKMKIYS